MASSQTVISIPWGSHHQPQVVCVGSRVRIERDPNDEPLPVEGTVVGVRVKRRDRIDVGQEAHYVILLVEQAGNGQAREFDLEEVSVMYI